MSGKKNPVVKFGGTTHIKQVLRAAGAPADMQSPYAMAAAVAAVKGLSIRGSKKKILERVMRHLTGWTRPVSAPRRPRIVVASVTTKSTKEAFYASWEWTTLRMQILKRYGRRCMCCGATPGNSVVIHVDHIKPISKYWELRLDPENLQVLCNTCNKGKGAWDETDYRPAA